MATTSSLMRWNSSVASIGLPSPGNSLDLLHWNCSTALAFISLMIVSHLPLFLRTIFQMHLITSFTHFLGGVFPTESRYATIELSQVSGMGIGVGRRGEGGWGRLCTAQTYYIVQSATRWLAHIVIGWDLDLYFKVCWIMYTCICTPTLSMVCKCWLNLFYCRR